MTAAFLRPALRAAALPCLLALPLAPSMAQAETNPYYLGMGAGLTHVSNLYRLSDASPHSSDWVGSMSLRAGIDQTFGRQRLVLDAALRHQRYRHNSALDNSGYSLSGGYSWEAFEKLSGTVSGSASRSLAAFNPGDRPSVAERNEQHNEQLNAQVRYGLGGAWQVEGGAGWLRERFSLASYSPYNYRQHSSNAGLNYRPRPGLRLGLSGRMTRGSYYERVVASGIGEELDRKELGLALDWEPGGASSYNARLGHARTTYRSNEGNNVSGLTASLQWNWQPSTKLRLGTQLARDAGLDSNSMLAGLIRTENNRSSTSLRFSLDYELTAKIALNAGLLNTRRELRYTSNLGQAVEGHDNSRVLTLGASWAPWRNTQLGCQYSHEERSSASTQFSLPYSANAFGCSAQLMLR
ncbi:outer membrane beta-barrel protein [Mitsuaria sp. WAJ17]|uniref:outer membrane beta-barrel protein n=1 Tax=Mitsuaria sp. WAJ17 TaxID=2761452 RepID=UPI0015FEE204|nr:outer membrane beta-barrel protein [Mitsuaria sp. WAJ17]MBB2484323.1 outer membrane beta-barrel protein [Mitsuaria sp. WAJ17]